MHLVDSILVMTLVMPLALAGPRGTLFLQAPQLRPHFSILPVHDLESFANDWRRQQLL